MFEKLKKNIKNVFRREEEEQPAEEQASAEQASQAESAAPGAEETEKKSFGETVEEVAVKVGNALEAGCTAVANSKAVQVGEKVVDAAGEAIEKAGKKVYEAGKKAATSETAKKAGETLGKAEKAIDDFAQRTIDKIKENFKKDDSDDGQE